MEKSLLFFILTSFFSVCSLIFSTSSTQGLTALFFLSLSTAGFVYMVSFNFLVVGLFLIIMMTGLFLVFSFVLSLEPSVPLVKSQNKFLWFTIIVPSVVSFNWKDLRSSSSGSADLMSELAKVSCGTVMNFCTSIFLLTLLLLLVILFMRLTYMNSGSIRKTF
nr:NADH dehydrogenase subunit 6 [Austromenopon atrofulvum]